MTGTPRVLVVDDSAVVRESMKAILGQAGAMQVDIAADPLIAMEKMKRDRPDAIVLDIEMPRMDGLTFLRKLMAEDPIPVVICSGLTGSGTDLAIRALAEGAVEVVTKPRLGVRDFLHESAAVLIQAVRGAAEAGARGKVRPSRLPAYPASLSAKRRGVLKVTTDQVVAVGASTGGTEALRYLLGAMPPDAPAMVIVQHMPEFFTAAFARRLDAECTIQVKEAQDGDRLMEGRALIAPGNHHVTVAPDGGHYVVRVTDGPLVSGHRPSVDVLFRSVAEAAGVNAFGVIMTGMGGDGARGLLEMRNAGAATFAQDEQSCVVFGMPKEAIALGAVEQVAPLEDLPRVVLEKARGPRPAAQI